jgi:hypothetical protein
MLDMILMTKSWESNFPTCFAWSRARVGLDHCPLILNSREQGFIRPYYFSFDDQWLFHEGFDASGSQLTWHGCLRKLRQFLKGWNLNWKVRKEKLRRN